MGNRLLVAIIRVIISGHRWLVTKCHRITCTPRNSPGVKCVFPTSRRIGDCVRCQRIAAQIKGVPDNQFISFVPDQGANVLVISRYIPVRWQDEGLGMGNTGYKAERCRCNIHFAVADQNVAVAAEPLDALVLMHIFMIGVEEIPMADDEIEHGVGVSPSGSLG